MTPTLSTREARVKAITDCIVDAHCAAYEPGGWKSNPHTPDDPLFSLWVREFNRELARIANATEKAAARQALADGRLAAFEEGEDLEAERRRDKRSVWQRLWDLFFNTRS